MKTTTFFPRSLCVLLALFLSIKSEVCFSQSPQGSHPVIIVQIPTEEPDTPRTPSFNPFFAYEDGSSVTLGSVGPYGDVAVTLVSTAGDYYQTVFDTEDGQVIIPISGDAGHYTLTLVTERGLVFEGEFDL